MRNRTEELSGVAYSYVRFSSKKQERGSSVERQEQLRDAWLNRHPRVMLDTILTLSDLGVSAFRGKHRTDDKAALSAFMRAVESGRVKPGSFLVVENLDRLTREDEIAATHLLTGLLLAGVRVVTLDPEHVFDRTSDQLELMRAVLDLGRGHGESLRKSQLLTAAWRSKKKAAAETRKAHGRACPAWLELSGGAYRFRPGARDLIRRVFKMCVEGVGARGIAVALRDENVPHWLDGSVWDSMYIRTILTRRETLGEFQPGRRENGRQVPDGDPVADYYPAAVTEAEWLAAREAMRARRAKGGRPPSRPDHVSLFAGLLYDGLTGDRLNCLLRAGDRLLMPANIVRRGVGKGSFPVDSFERGVLSRLVELDPRDVFGETDRPDRVAELRAKLVRIDTQLQAMADQFDGDDIPQIAAKVREKNAERKAAAESLEEAIAKAASPRSAAWGEAVGLVDAIDRAKDKRAVRLRLKQALARIIESVTVVLAKSGLTRLAAARVKFFGDQHRDYIVAHTPNHAPSRRKRGWVALSFSDAGVPDGFDLRVAADAAKLERFLSKLDPSAL